MVTYESCLPMNQPNMNVNGDLRIMSLAVVECEVGRDKVKPSNLDCQGHVDVV